MAIDSGFILNVTKITFYIIMIILMLIILWILFRPNTGYYNNLIPLIDDIISSEKCKGHIPKTNIGGVVIDLVCKSDPDKPPYSKIGNIYNTIENINRLLNGL